MGVIPKRVRLRVFPMVRVLPRLQVLGYNLLTECLLVFAKLHAGYIPQNKVWLVLARMHTGYIPLIEVWLVLTRIHAQPERVPVYNWVRVVLIKQARPT